VVDDRGKLLGVLTRRAHRVGLRGIEKVAIFADNSLREAADQMVRENVGRLPVVSREDPRRLAGFITRSDLLRAHERRLAQSEA